MGMIVGSHSVHELEKSLLSIGTVSLEYDPMVPLKTSGSKMPLFLLHPGGGEFLCWIDLLQYLLDRPIYALRAKGHHKGEDVFESLDEILRWGLSFHANQVFMTKFSNILPVATALQLGAFSLTVLMLFWAIVSA